ncbi:MAG: peptide deformylase [Candidatus Uhrbacteria bacterium]|nr:peptide deformylase [Candidatus Uhrbacteria bacterium]
MYHDSWTIITHPDDRLRGKAEDVLVQEITTPEFQAFADTFGAFMIESDGVGLAAPQIGLKKRIIAVLEKDKINVYANPEILKASQALQESEEGCLSVPKTWGLVDRPKRLRIRAINRHGRSVEFDVSGFTATVFDHEIDHLNGVLFIDKAKKIKKK